MPLKDRSFQEVFRSLSGEERAIDQLDRLVGRSHCSRASLCARPSVATDVLALVTVQN